MQYGDFQTLSIIYGIDVGSDNSGVCVWDTEKQKILYSNEADPNTGIPWGGDHKIDYYVIEDIKSYGMPVGKTTFDTCKAIGRFQVRLEKDGQDYYLVFKPEIQLHFCHSSRAKDANIARVLKDRFGEKGTKKNQGTLYQLVRHAWDAFALCIYLEDHIIDGEIKF